MTQLITDEEITLIVRECARGSSINRDGSTSHRIARAIEAAVINKLNSAEPVAWLQTSVEDNVDTVIARTHKPDKFNAEWWRFEHLYLHPVPSVPEGHALVPINPEGQGSNDDLINSMVDAYQDSNGSYYDSMLAAYKAMIAAARSE